MQYVFGALFKGINRKLEALAFIPLIVNNHSRHVIQSLNSKTYSLNVKVLFTNHYTWQNFLLRLLRLVNTKLRRIYLQDSKV